jgi:GAF domain-containing protein
MKSTPMPENEKERLEAVHKMAILDTESESRFDDITREATEKLKVPISTITILDEKREWFKSYQGLSKREGERAVSFCGHALLAKNIFFVEDTLKDPRFADNPMVVGSPYIRFYGGIALVDHKSGQYVGVFCVKDTKPRSLTAEEVETFIDLADRAEKELNK